MDITINIEETAAVLANREVYLRERQAIVEHGTDYLQGSPFKGGIFLEDEITYTPEAQKYFDREYKLWYEFLLEMKIAKNE